MEEVREVALAYYSKLPEEQRREAYAIFLALDSNGDGTLTKSEIEHIFGSSYSSILFQELDKNGDGKLDFKEFVTFYYLCKSGRIVFCDGCRVLLPGLYFTCFTCFHYNKTTTFDLCSSCYKSEKYTHNHANFVDNYLLLRTKAAYRCDDTPAAQPQGFQASKATNVNISRATVVVDSAEKVAKVANAAVNVATVDLSAVPDALDAILTVGSAVCTVM